MRNESENGDGRYIPAAAVAKRRSIRVLPFLASYVAICAVSQKSWDNAGHWEILRVVNHSSVMNMPILH